MTRWEDLPDDPDPKAGRRPRGLDRVLFLASGILLVTFALVPLAYQAQQCSQRDEEAPAARPFFQGAALARRGDDQGARRVFQEMLAEPAAREAGLAGLAYLQLRRGDAAEADRLCGLALERDPQDRYALAVRAHRREGGRESLEALDRALDALAETGQAPAR